MHTDSAHHAPESTPVRLIATPKKGLLHVMFLGPYSGLITHWTTAGSIPCLGEERCAQRVHACKEVWKGYAAVDVWEPITTTWYAAVLEITESLEHLLAGESLRGSVWALHRGGKGRHQEVIGRLEERRPVSSVRDAFDFRDLVESFFRMRELTWGVPNPVEPRRLMEILRQAGPQSQTGGDAPKPQRAKELPREAPQAGRLADAYRMPQPGRNGE